MGQWHDDPEIPIANKPHWPALDGVRAVAVLAVIGLHLQRPHFARGGALGVTVFFVLSGFLITTLLIGEWNKRGGQISLRNFYARRALRLYPAFVVVVAFAILSSLFVVPDRWASVTFHGLPWVIIYAGNWIRATGGHLGLLNHTWSLAVEEQFYLIWPLCFIVLSRLLKSRQQLARLCFLLAMGIGVERYLLFHFEIPNYRITSGTDMCADALLIGCATACWMSDSLRSRTQNALRSAGPICGLIVLVALWSGLSSSHRLYSVEYSGFVIATAVLIGSLVLNDTAISTRLLGAQPLVWLGRRSYGLYLWHYLVLRSSAGSDSPQTIPMEILGVGLSVAAAALSYRYVEQPFLKRKRRFEVKVEPAMAHTVPK